ncbi:MAG: bifunctional nicotinamidase/pyrazinamidase [Coriobacteriia bacterium]|nr:bifunctional nicotinamidase/pyrazinamidase [Coriobacteriia bacterium]
MTMPNKLDHKKALILVDIQNDFCHGGALAVPDADEVVDVANRLAYQFIGSGDIVVATRDLHPPDHGSFASQAKVEVGTIGELGGITQVFWPDHCVLGSKGADFHPGLQLDLIDRVFAKGQDKHIDSYSGFFDNDHKTSTGLYDFLVEKNVSAVTIVGLATDYCVAATARDAIALGFDTTVVAEGCRAVDLAAGDGERALEDLRQIGVTII